jgi:Ni/Co efflux regulator RcnB
MDVLFILAGARLARLKAITALHEEHTMRRMSILMLALSLTASGAAMATAKDPDDRGRGKDSHDQRHDKGRDDHRPPAHHDNGRRRYGRGDHLDNGRRGVPVDYHHHHLKPPPPGHEWRRVDEDYVLVAVATGIIVSVIAASQ